MFGNLAEKLFLGLIGFICIFSRDPSRREPRMTYRQRRALKGLSSNEQQLLVLLWKETINCNLYSDAYARGHLDKATNLDVALRRYEERLVKCIEIRIPEDRIQVFQINPL